MSNSKKVVAAVIGFSMALTAFAAVGASNASAQAMTLSQLVDLFISLGIISPDKAAAAKAAVTSSVSVSFTRDLTVGSSGSDVTALQNTLGVSPATGYFGSITKAAVMSYQASKGVPATGYVGPLTRAALNQSSVGSMPSVPGSNNGSPVVNSGVEGTLSADQSNSGVVSTTYEGNSMVPVLGVKLEAKNSDISVQRVKLDLGTETKIYNKIYDTIYVTEGNTVLAQADLNSNTVVKDSGRYYITLAGFNLVVPRNGTKTLLVKVDVKPSIDSTDIDTEEYTIRLATDGIRGVDGAGIDQYFYGAVCMWTVSSAAGSIDVTFGWFENNSLQRERTVADQLGYQVEATTIAGTSAFSARRPGDSAACGITAAYSGVITWWVQQRSGTGDPCDGARTLAELTLQRNQ